jgi:hypothetical protein
LAVVVFVFAATSSDHIRVFLPFHQNRTNGHNSKRKFALLLFVMASGGGSTGTIAPNRPQRPLNDDDKQSGSTMDTDRNRKCQQNFKHSLASFVQVNQIDGQKLIISPTGQ